MAEIPAGAFETWDGAALREARLAPRLTGVALSNAFPSCPTGDGVHFRAPTNAELRSAANLSRVTGELRRAALRSPGPLAVIALGRRAGWLLGNLDGAPPIVLEVLPHPSAQGLLQAAPGKGKGLKLDDLREAWMARLVALLRRAQGINKI